MAVKKLTYYNQTYETLSIGADMESNGFTRHPYAAEGGTFLAIAGIYGEVVGAAPTANWPGGFEKDGGAAWGDKIFEHDVISHAGGRTIVGVNSSATGVYWVQLLPGGGIMRLYKADRTFLGGQVQLADWDSVAPASISSMKIITETISGDVKISVYVDDVFVAEYTDSTYQFTTGSIIFSAFQTGWVNDNIDVYANVTHTYTVPEYIKRSNLITDTTIDFYKNLGTTLDTAIDITDQVVNVGELTAKLTKSSVNVGGVLLPNLKIGLNNARGNWNKGAKYFGDGFINNSVIEIETKYQIWNDETEVYDDLASTFKYSGIIKYSSCRWDREKFIFQATLVPGSSLISSEKIAPGILSHTTFKNICFKILNRQPFTKYLTINLSNFTMGWDISAIDSYADMSNKKVKSVLDEIMLLTGSVYYIDYNGNFIIAPITPASPSAICTLRGDDIFNISFEDYDWKGQYTGIVWDDDENAVQRVEMNYPDRELYQYDYVELTLNKKYVTDSANRLTIMNNLLTLYKFIKRKIKLSCKWNPEIIVNEYIALDVAKETIKDDRFMVWNQDQWNAGKFWGLSSPGISFLSSELWRVVDVRLNVEGEKMDLKIVQLYSDDEL